MQSLSIATTAAAVILAPAMAVAHDGLHHHPHGVEGIWVGLALGLGVGVAGWLVVRGRK